MSRVPRASLLALLVVASALAGCQAKDPTARIAIPSLAGPVEAHALADFIGTASGRPFDLVTDVHSDADAVAAVVDGRADAAFVEGGAALWAWLHPDWDVRVVAAATYGGETRPVAAAWVLDDERFPDLASLAGARSCHPSPWDMAGTLWPLAAFVREGLVEPDAGLPASGTEDAAFMDATDTFVEGQWAFSMGRGTVAPYGGYAGALQCLSRGHGDVAFTLDAAPAWACDPTSDVYAGPASAPPWCLPADRLHRIATFAAATGTVVIAGPSLGPSKQFDLVETLIEAHEGAGGPLLAALFESDRFVVADERDVLEPAIADAEAVPGLGVLVAASGRRA